MEYDYSKPRQYFIYKAMRAVAKISLPVLYNAKYLGKENIPKTGGYIIACNHQKGIDPGMICIAVKKPIHFMAKQELFDDDFVGFWCKHCNAFPVKRGEGDMSAINYAVEVIKRDWILGIFPEGRCTTDFKPSRAKSGVALIAKMTGADVLPVSIYTEDEYKQGKPLTIRFGKLIKNEEFGFSEEHSPRELRNVSKRIMDEIVALWEEGHCER